MMDYDINRFFSMGKEKNKKNLWEEVENKIGIIFPEDYKKFIDLYGEGVINDFLWILSPFCENENLNNIKKFKVMQDAYMSMQDEFPKLCPYNFYNGKTGLFPWGITDNGDELFWNFDDNTIEIVVFESRYVNNMRYEMCMEEFLCGLLKKEIVCNFFPDDFILENNYYKKI